MNIIRIADFFCGVGGIRLGFELASSRFQCVFSNDIDKNAITTYETNFSSHPVVCKSISDLTVDEIPDFDIFLGGFPCQSFSIAGNRKGFDDSRGNLFFDIVRIIRAKKPMIFVLENVKNLKSHQKGETYRKIKNELCRAGYYFKCKIMNSAEYGNVPQNRERIYLVGFRDRNLANDFQFPKQILKTKNMISILENNVIDKYYYTTHSTIYNTLVESITDNVDTNQVYQYRRHYVRKNMSCLCPTLTANMGSGGHNVPIIKDNNGIRKLTPRECFSLQGFPKTYNLPELADSNLYKQAGNSVTVSVIKRISQQIVNLL